MIPNLFVIGAPKCGTTLVHSVLAQFPDVFMSTVKEPGFFSNDNAYSRGLAHYVETYFAHVETEPWVGEATPWYLYSTAALSRIRSTSAAPRFVVCLRDPAERARSMFADQVRAGWEQRPAAQALVANPPQHTRLEQRYFEGGLYARYLEPWIDSFGWERFLVLTSQDLASSASLADTLAEFLGVVPPNQLDSSKLERNAAGATRSAFVTQLLRKASASRGGWKTAVRRVVPESAIRGLGQAVVRWNHSGAGHSQEVPPACLEDLQERYASSVIELEGLLDRDFTSWASHPRHKSRGPHA